MKKLLLALLTIAIVSCSKDDPENAMIDYYIKAQPSTEYEHVSFTFDYVRAMREGEIRTVYLDQQDISINVSADERVRLGSSEIEPERINSYDVELSAFTVVRNGDTIPLAMPAGFEEHAPAGFTPGEGENTEVTFVLDLEASVVDSLGEQWIMPRISISR